MDRLLLKTSRTTIAFMLMMAMGTVSLTISVSGFPASASACHPLSNSGHCCRAGQFCRYADAGKKGIASNGSRIICRNNNGLRWEPY